MRVGILGGGQLGAILAESMLHLGATPIVFDPDPDPHAPARCRVPEVIEMKIYGKTHPEQLRKMEHSVVIASTSEDAFVRAESFHFSLKSPREY